MLHKRLAALFIPVVIAGVALASTGVAFAGSPAQSQSDTSEKAAKLGKAFSVLHAVSDWSSALSAMADTRSKSLLVKGYASAIATANGDADAKLQALAEKLGIDIVALDPQTEQGKSLLARIKAETVLLASLDGDAFDKEYMTLVTNTQQSVIRFLDKSKASAANQDVEDFIGGLSDTVQKRLDLAQDIMAKVYGDDI